MYTNFLIIPLVRITDGQDQAQIKYDQRMISTKGCDYVLAQFTK